MREIVLGTGRGEHVGLVALVDDEDYLLVSLFGWSIFESHGYPAYARTEVKVRGTRYCFFIHKYLLGLSSEQRIDHRNGNGLDNRRENIRVCSGSMNAKNRKLNSDNSIGYKGVTLEFGKYRAQIHSDKCKFHLGMYSSPEEAARAYDEAALQLHKEFARTNRDLGLLP